MERNVVSVFVFIVLRAIPFRDIRNVERRRRIDDILDTHIFKVSKVTTRGRELEGEWYVLLRACIFVLLPLDRFSSSLDEIWSPKLTGHHQRYALALKGKLRYCYSSLSCGLCLLGQMLRSKNQHRGPTAGFETRLTRDFSSISTLLAFRYPSVDKNFHRNSFKSQERSRIRSKKTSLMFFVLIHAYNNGGGILVSRSSREKFNLIRWYNTSRNLRLHIFRLTLCSLGLPQQTVVTGIEANLLTSVAQQSFLQFLLFGNIFFLAAFSTTFSLP